VTVVVAEITLYKSLCNCEVLFATPASQFTYPSIPLKKIIPLGVYPCRALVVIAHEGPTSCDYQSAFFTFHFSFSTLSFSGCDLVFQSGDNIIEPFELNSEGIRTSLCSGLPLIVEDSRG
jgi:hypothetical protein